MSNNYKVGSKFRVTSNTTNGFEIGEIVTLISKRADGLFEMGNGKFQQALYGDQFELVCEPASPKLKPAKQALADAIHQNGGWRQNAAMAIFGKHSMECAFVHENEGEVKYNQEIGSWRIRNENYLGGFKMKPFVNWHQTCLSRDEYFTAYPEQVNVVVKNETEHKVEVEMKSESEMTIKASDWHKNGELPPAGTWCTLHAKENNGEEVMFIGVTSCSSPVFETVQNMIFVERGEFRFSPLRTERERAIDEMVGVARDIGYSSKNSIAIIGDVASAMYDLGYRKEVK